MFNLFVETTKNFNISSYLSLEGCLFEVVSFTKNNDVDMYKYSGYGIVFAGKENFLLGNGFRRNNFV